MTDSTAHLPTEHEGAAMAPQLTDVSLPPEDRDGWDLLVVEGPVHELSDEVLTYGPDAVVEGPAALRDDVVQRLLGAVSKNQAA